MALSLTLSNYSFRDKLADCLVRKATMTGPVSYLTGGIPINNLSDFGWSDTHQLQGILTNGTNFYALALDRANQKVIVVNGSGTQLANATDLSGYTGEIIALGK